MNDDQLVYGAPFIWTPAQMQAAGWDTNIDGPLKFSVEGEPYQLVGYGTVGGARIGIGKSLDGNYEAVYQPLPEVTVTASPGKSLKTANGDYANTSDDYYKWRVGTQFANNVNKASLGMMAFGSAPVTISAAPLSSALNVLRPFAPDILAGTEIGTGADLAMKLGSGRTYGEWGQYYLSPYLKKYMSPETANIVGDLAGESFNPGGWFGNYKNLANVGKYKANETVKEAVSNPNVFASELDWSPENWFGTRTTGAFDAEDVAALRAHIPEYHAIEKAAKKNGTWLKMPDGSTWEGDPRSWVQLQSKDGQKLLQKPLYHGNSNIYINTDGNDVTPSTLGKGVLWASSNKHLPLTYGNKHYTFAIPKGTPMVEINAGGKNWNNLKGLNLGYKDTNDISWDLLNNDNTVRIKNVVDIGSDPRWRPGRNGLPQEVPNEEITHYIDRVFKGDDYILGEDVPRKSLLGNNGNFDFTKSNIYKGLIPIALPIGIGYSLNK